MDLFTELTDLAACFVMGAVFAAAATVAWAVLS